MLPNGEYVLSQTQVAEAVEKDESSIRQFGKSKSPEALPYKDYTPVKMAIKKDHEGRVWLGVSIAIVLVEALIPLTPELGSVTTMILNILAGTATLPAAMVESSP